MHTLTQVDKVFNPKAPGEEGEWAPGYHGTLYNLTDDAIQVCPPSARWLVVTNGDNEYSQDFMQRVRGLRGACGRRMDAGACVGGGESMLCFGGARRGEAGWHCLTTASLLLPLHR